MTATFGYNRFFFKNDIAEISFLKFGCLLNIFFDNFLNVVCNLIRTKLDREKRKQSRHCQEFKFRLVMVTVIVDFILDLGK